MKSGGLKSALLCGLPLGFEAELANGLVEIGMVEFLLFDDAGDVAEVFLGAAFAIKFEFVEDDVFGRGKIDGRARGFDAADFLQRPWQ